MAPFQAPAPTGGTDPFGGAALGSPSPAGGVTSTDGMEAGGRPGRAGLIVAFASVAVVIALVSALLGGIAGGFIARRGVVVPALPPLATGTTVRPAGSIADIAAKALPSVVTIRVDGATGDGTGSGFVLRSDGYLLTNNHVIASAVTSGTITVLFTDGTSAAATIRGRDASYDLAVLKVNRTGLPALALGDSDAVVVGDQVIAVGAPLGLDSTVTSGIVSALNRPVTPGGDDSQAYINAIQTDAAINPGNSGGPLLDMSGRVVGINSAIARIPGLTTSSQSGNIGVGFAIPSKQARTTADQLIATGKAQHPIVGVLLDPDYTGPGIKISATPQNGRTPVTKDGPADRAGLQAGDIILELDGTTIEDAGEFVVAIRSKSVGDTIRLTYRHSGSEHTVTVTLQGATD